MAYLQNGAASGCYNSGSSSVGSAVPGKDHVTSISQGHFFIHNNISILILSRLVDTFSSRILYLMLLLSVYHSIAVVLASEADLHWWSKSSGYSSS